jgi:ankyrin repeat protein
LNQTFDVVEYDGEKKTALDEAVELWGKSRKVTELLVKVSDANGRSEGGKTALHRAARDGNEEAVRMLMESGWSADVRDSFGITPLHEAENERVLRIMLEGGGIRYIELADNDGRTALDWAAIKGNVKNDRDINRRRSIDQRSDE